MSNILKLITVSVTVLMLSFSGPAKAQDLRPGTSWSEMEFGLQKTLLSLLERVWPKEVSRDTKPIGISSGKGDTTGCPSNCDDVFLGGLCHCSPDDNGNCPAGTQSPAPGKDCRVPKGSYRVIFNGRPEPVQVITHN